ncbi:MAG: flagellar basal body rod protein FlgC [Pseudomonadota bacterium]|jgi:flagellar basal-body rod protein FlgC
MDHNQIFAVSAQGMSLERTRLEVATLNLANAHTLVGPDGSGYQPLSVVARSVGFGVHFNEAKMSVGVVASPRAPRQVYEPSHPNANAAGMVFYPNIDPAQEMMTVMTATRAYEANVGAMNAARAMSQKALEIGGTR